MRKILPILLLLTLIFLVLGDIFYTKNNTKLAQQKIYNRFQNEFKSVENDLSKYFSLNYYILRSIAMLDSVKKYESKKKFKKSTGEIIIQQFFNQLALVNYVSEIYIVPSKVLEAKDLTLAKSMMFEIDEVKITKSEEISLGKITDHSREKFEINEIKNHLKYFKTHISHRNRIRDINYPMLCGSSDTYIGDFLPKFKKNVFVCSIPIYLEAGNLKGIISIVIKNSIVEKLLRKKRFYLFKTKILDEKELEKKNYVSTRKISFFDIIDWEMMYIVPLKEINQYTEMKSVRFHNNLTHLSIILLIIFVIIIFVYQSDNKLMRKLNLKLNKEIQQRKESESRLEQFTSDAGHEIRSPIAVIKAEVEINLKRDRSLLEYKGALSNILIMVNRLEKIVKNLLTLARSKDGLDLNLQIFKLHETLDEYKSIYKILYPNNKITIKNMVPKDLEIMADKEQFEQVVINFLSNSSKYCEDDCVVNIFHELKNNKIFIHFCDNGIGIPEDKLNNIYDRFFRIDEVRTIGKDGLGLGLSICKKIIEAHNGFVHIKNNEKNGITISIELDELSYE